MKTSFGKFAELWDRKVGEDGGVSEQLSIKSALKLIGGIKNKKIYDIACGNGFLVRMLEKRGAKEIWASDVAPEMIALAKNKYKINKIKYLAREATNFTNIPNNYFDI